MANENTCFGKKVNCRSLWHQMRQVVSHIPKRNLQLPPANKAEIIQADEYGDWRCLCGNTAMHEGFYPCDEWGRAIDEPTWINCYACDRCGRIIHQDTRRVVAYRVILVLALMKLQSYFVNLKYQFRSLRDKIR